MSDVRPHSSAIASPSTDRNPPLPRHADSPNIEDILREREAQLRLALEAGQTGIWLWDVPADRVTWSDECYRIFGIAQASFGGTAQAFSDAIHPEDHARVWQCVRDAMAHHTPYTCEFRIVRPDGAVRWVANAGRVSYGPDGAPILMTGTLTDITQQRESQLALARAKEEAEAASKAKDVFLAMVSHELRTPLSPVLLAVSALLDDHALPAEIRSTLQLVLRNIEIEARLIDDLLDLSRTIGGKLLLACSPARLHDVIRAAIEVVRPEAKARGVALCLQFGAASDTLEVDATRLQQAVWNVLGNAVKFTPAGGRVDIRTALSPARDHFVVTVTDTGLGIAPADLERIFNPFEQATGNVSRQFGGLGLGLAIARSIIEAHGGALPATSLGEDHGATFTITLPLRK